MGWRGAALNYGDTPVASPGGGYISQAVKDSFYIDVKQFSGKSHVWGNGFSFDTPFFKGAFTSNYHGSNVAAVNGAYCDVKVYANIPAGANGGNCPYAIPRQLDARPLFAGPFYSGTPCAGGNIAGQGAINIQRVNPAPIVDTNPDTDDDTTYNYATAPAADIGYGDDQQWDPALQSYTEEYHPVDYYPAGVLPIYGDPAPVAGFLYNFHTLPIWEANALTKTPAFDTTGASFSANVSSGFAAYWRLGTQEGGPAIPGVGIRGYMAAVTGALGTIVYTIPVYIPGPKEYFTDVSVDIPADNSKAPPSLKLKHLTLLQPDTPIGFATIGYIDLNSPTLSQDIVTQTVTFYARPQRYIPGFQT